MEARNWTLCFLWVPSNVLKQNVLVSNGKMKNCQCLPKGNISVVDDIQEMCNTVLDSTAINGVKWLTDAQEQRDTVISCHCVLPSIRTFLPTMALCSWS